MKTGKIPVTTVISRDISPEFKEKLNKKVDGAPDFVTGSL